MKEYYVAHDIEKGKIWRGIKQAVPEVYWLNNTAIPLTEAWQKLIYQMNQPGMTKKWFRQNLGWNVAWCNYTGFNEPGDPRKDYINKKDLNNPNARLPFLDKSRCCSMILHGKEEDGFLIVETLDGSKPPPSWKELQDKYWLYFYAIEVDKNGRTFNFPYRGGLRVLMPLVAIGTVRIQLNNNIDDKPIPYVTRI